MTNPYAFLESLQNLINVLVNETRQLHYLVHQASAHERRKAGSRSQRFTFQCVNCGTTATKRTRARYCSARCRKQAERKREAALLFYTAYHDQLSPFVREQAKLLLLRRDQSREQSLRKNRNSRDKGVHNC